MSKKKYVLQENIKDCAVACLYNVIKYYDGYISMDKLRNKLNVNKDGTSVYDIVKTANELGLKSSAYECELNDLCNLNMPIIAHMKVEGKYDHFIIIDKIIDDEIIIFDPIRGYLKYDLEDFENQWNNIIITFEKTNSLIKETKISFIYNIVIHLSKNSYVILIVFFISILSSFLSVLHSLYLSYLHKQNDYSISMFYLFIVICILKLFIDYIRNKKILNYTKKFDINITEKTYKKILSLPLTYHHTRPVGDIVSRINDLSSIKEFINNISFSFIIDFTYVLLISIILFIINKLLFILLLIMTIIYVIVYLIYRKIIVNKSYIVKQYSSKASTYLIESLFGIDTIKNINIEDVRINNFNKEYEDFLDKQFDFNKLIINLNLLQDFISNITIILITFISIIIFKKNIISFSYVIAFNSLMIYYFISIKNIISIDNLLIEAKNSYKRLSELYNEKEEEKKKNINKINKITINKLSYSYNNINNIIKNVNFNIDNNDLIFVKGKSGVGKSTIFKILTKQLKINRNMVKINDIDINDISNKSIIDNICYVSQNEYIFTDTILNNIKLYKDYNAKEVDKIIKITNIDEILKKRNITLDFLLEENGHNLSGGERQRIILARSLLQNKKVLILDETLNELDAQSERKILKNIIKEFNITLILISHRDNNSDLFKKIIQL